MLKKIEQPDVPLTPPYRTTNFATVQDYSKLIGWNAKESLPELINLPKAHTDMEKAHLKHIDVFKVTEFTGNSSDRVNRMLDYHYNNYSSLKEMRQDIVSILEQDKIKHDGSMELKDF